MFRAAEREREIHTKGGFRRDAEDAEAEDVVLSMDYGTAPRYVTCAQVLAGKMHMYGEKVFEL